MIARSFSLIHTHIHSISRSHSEGIWASVFRESYPVISDRLNQSDAGCFLWDVGQNLASAVSPVHPVTLGEGTHCSLTGGEMTHREGG